MRRLLQLCVCAAILSHSVALADPGRALLVDIDDELHRRIVGQTSDLGWTLSRVDGPRPSNLSEAEDQAGESRVVIWVDSEGQTWTLYFADIEHGRMLVRRFPFTASESQADSAQLETLALAIRSALQALSLGGSVGIVPPEPEPEVEPNAAPENLPPAEEPAPRSSWGLAGTIGWLAAWDGESPIGHGPAGELMLRYERLRLGVLLHAALSSRLDDASTSLSLSRQTFALEGGLHLLGSQSWELEALGRAGLVRYRRETTALAPQVSPTEGATVISPLLGASVRLQWVLHPIIALSLDVGADVVPLAPRFQYLRGAELIERNRLWSLQPRARLGLVVRAGT